MAERRKTRSYRFADETLAKLDELVAIAKAAGAERDTATAILEALIAEEHTMVSTKPVPNPESTLSYPEGGHPSWATAPDVPAVQADDWDVEARAKLIHERDGLPLDTATRLARRQVARDR